MKIEVHLYATLARFLPPGAAEKTCWMELSGGEGVAGIIKRLGIPANSVKLIFVNGMHAPKDAALHDGDRVGLFPPVGGG
ncbi:MAG: MoaD/ThiS family protein [Desulfosalsimonadaceae bacterium]